jgi:colanic acid/amylovoran biosynthesis glycosyltransferase
MMALQPETRIEDSALGAPTPDPKAHPAQSAGAPHVRRLVYLLSRYPGVSHTFLLNEVRALRKLGFAIDVASINPPDIPGVFAPDSGAPTAETEESARTYYIKATGAAHAIKVAAKTLLRHPRTILRGVIAALRLGRGEPVATLYAFLYLAEALILGDWMRNRDQQHLHIHFSGPVATVGLLTSIAWQVPYSLTVHGPDEFFDEQKFYLKQKIEHAQFILCISDFCRSQLMRIVPPEHWDKMHVVRLGVDPAVFSPVSKTHIPGDALEVLCVGRLVPAKGQLILLQACELLLARGYSLRVRLVGAGPDRQHLETYAAQHNIPAIFEGARTHNETRALLARADIFALASFAEGVPVALMEAMAMEVPCVSTSIAGIPELIRDGLDGLLVPASSVEALAAALQRFFDDPSLRRSLAVAGARRVAEYYNLPRNIRTLAQVFTQRLPERNPSPAASNSTHTDSNQAHAEP